MPKYNPRKIEKKWQEAWAKSPKLYAADEKSKKPKFYCLDMFPYPSGDGLHVGHVESYTASDIYSRYQRMIGKNVLHPIGWDAFGLPAENFAIKTGMHPDKSTHRNIKNFTRQIKSLGLFYDWSREIDTSSSEYYKWTQWFFLFLYKHGLAYRKRAKVNWCESCKTVLANEQVEDGVCERCKNEVVQKDLEQWFFRITDFAEDLMDDLDKIDWPESTKTAQKNWIGKSEGVTVIFKVRPSKFLRSDLKNDLEVFTTRPDTIYGCTYCVVAPEHDLISNFKFQISNYREVEKYIAKAKKKTDLERTELQKEKTGIEIKGLRAINPFTNEAVPIFVADYVLFTYGTGAVMAVPAHDERDFEFAKKYKLPIQQVISPDVKDYKKTVGTLEILRKINDAAKKEGIKIWVMGGLGCAFHAGVIYRSHEDLDLIAKDNTQLKKAIKIFEKLGFKKIGEKKISKRLTNHIFADKNGIEIDIGPNVGEWGLSNKDFEGDRKELNRCEAYVLSQKFHISLKEFLQKNRAKDKDNIDLAYLKGKVFVEDGCLVNSGKYSGLTSEKAREQMAKWLEKNKLGKRTTTYKLRDWLISRQRYWGAPIPMIHCEKCGWQPVPEKELPVLLPKVKDYRPKGTSPLGTNPDFVRAVCPKCKGEARRELDTMDTFVCSSWYFFRFADPWNLKEFASRGRIEKWMPIDLYIGGAEHTVLHLLYSRFFTKALHKYKYISFNEPFAKLRHQGMIVAEDGRKMSKSLGNVVNPDDLVRQYGADTLRLYEMFMGPLEDAKVWNTKSIVGLKRFLEKIWNFSQSWQKDYKDDVEANKGNISIYKKSGDDSPDKRLNSALHRTIKSVTEDIDNLKFNTAISALMVFLNYIRKEPFDEGNSSKKFIEEIKLTAPQLGRFLIMLAPFAPHISEELWSQMGHKTSIFLEKWPAYDPKLVVENEITLIIQVNGKVRDQITVVADAKESEIKKSALASEKIKKYIPNVDDIQKIIFVPGRLINLVV